jgi:hypothetical protein
MPADIIFLAHGRPEFTQAAVIAALRNSNPSMVRRFYIYTDGDEAATAALEPVTSTLNRAGEWTADGPPAGRIPIEVESRRLGGPVAIMSHYLDATAGDPAEYFAKIDNDLIVCPGWLDACLDTMRRHPNLDLLGIEPWCPELAFLLAGKATSQVGANGVHPYQHVGGIGVMRLKAFEGRRRPVPDERAVTVASAPSARPTKISFGWTGWQWDHPEVTKAFLNPPLPVFLLDHLPFDPWLSLSNRYKAEGVQREPWGLYPDQLSNLWSWWLAPQGTR